MDNLINEIYNNYMSMLKPYIGNTTTFSNDLNKKGHTIIVVTHESEVAEFAKRIIYLRDGLMVSDKEVKNRRTKLT